MPYDTFVLGAVVRELRDLIGARIERIVQPEPLTIIFTLYRPGLRTRLCLSAHPTAARLHLTAAALPNPPQPPLFCLVLRKHIEGWKLKAIEQLPGERICCLTLAGRDEIGTPGEKYLYIEIMGRHSNLVLVDSSGQIIDGIKRYTHAVSRYREVLPGRPYLLPPSSKVTVESIRDEEHLSAICFALTEQNDRGNKAENTRKEKVKEKEVAIVLQSAVQGLSIPAAREIIFRAGLPVDLKLEECGLYEWAQIFRSLTALQAHAAAGKFTPTLFLSTSGQPVDFAAFDLTHIPGSRRYYDQMNYLVETFYAFQQTEKELTQTKQRLVQVIKKEMKSISQKIERKEEALSTSADGEKFRLYADLLMTNLHSLPRGSEEVTLVNIFSPDQEPITIPLNPALTTVANAQQYYKKYHKSKATAETARQQLTELMAELSYLESVEVALQHCTTTAELAEIEEELREAGYLPAPPPAGRDKRQQLAAAEPYTFISSDGLTIIVGKNNRQNDALLRRAHPDDLWLHTQNIPGAHVYIRQPGAEIPPQTLAEAAALAAYFSRARQDSKVAVDYTRCRYVHKPRGSKPGFVNYTDYKTIIISPQLAAKKFGLGRK